MPTYLSLGLFCRVPRDKPVEGLKRRLARYSTFPTWDFRSSISLEFHRCVVLFTTLIPYIHYKQVINGSTFPYLQDSPIINISTTVTSRIISHLIRLLRRRPRDKHAIIDRCNRGFCKSHIGTVIIFLFLASGFPPKFLQRIDRYSHRKRPNTAYMY